ncbi:MAG: glycosyltransferase family 9 protein [Sulfuritalea sp.]|nr:glycosyltransferase family 9 protein [Sulfuritalea sp.]
MRDKSLLVLAPSPGIGDFIVRIPAVKLLAKCFRVTLICPLPEQMRRFAEECLGEKEVELVLAGEHYRKSKSGIILGHWGDLLYAWKHRRSSTACLLMSDSNSLFGIAKYTAISLLACNAARRFAILPGKGKFFRHENIAIPGDLQKMARYFEFSKLVLSALEQPSEGKWDDCLPLLRPAPQSPYVVLAPGGKYRRQWWPHFDALAKWLRDRDIRTVVVGSSDERGLIEGIRQSGQEALLGADLREVSRTLENASVLVCNDSGLLHLAVWRGTRVIAICGPRFAATWTGYPESRVIQLYEGRPANLNEDEDPEYRARCLADIGSDRVVVEVSRILG